MCSVFMTNKPAFDLDAVNRFIRLRGPDHTEVIHHDGLTFVHNLLSISGAFTVQPFARGDVTALFNGEIYNFAAFGEFSSDGECLIPAYRALGCLFPQALDGEFAIILADMASRSLVVSTDVFATKPLHFGTDGRHFGLASYASALQAAGFDKVVKLPANTVFHLSLDAPVLQRVGRVHTFSLVQYRQDFDAWFEAFELAVRKRTENCREKVFIGLSSGYDSGAISCALNKFGLPYNAYSVTGKENDAILQARAARFGPGATHRYLVPSEPVRSKARAYIDAHVEPLYYVTYSAQGDYNEFNLKLHDDSGATGLSIVCDAAVSDGCKVYLSGQGADEIMSDYGFAGQRIYPHSNFGGLFPADLSTIFPWPSFFGSSQESYLMKEEHVAGSYGIEARYPFLDKRVVQEFLALDPRLKNSRYKSALRAYLEANQFPTAFDMKIGF
jgi:asparagine synthetase B (glutamine-hydrolysing)